ncbi:hypothetical protein Barb4_03373 [Bacteroidales bacterium Barb4]|nr:hypothetical protein Barb4_03373 [Bacteroidales bacterium Barb4]
MFEGSVNPDAAVVVSDEFAKQITMQTAEVLDNAPIHRSKKFTDKAAQRAKMDLQIRFLHPYSPELNKTEMLRRFIKYNRLPFEAFLNFQNLKGRLTDALHKIGSECQIKFY